MSADFSILPERQQDGVHIKALLDRVFGPGRFVRAAYRLREGRACIKALSFVACEADRLIGSVRFWPVLIGQQEALLLGPLAVDSEFRGQGVAQALIEQSCKVAAKQGHRLMILVGDLDYYRRMKFKQIAGEISLPGHVDNTRILVRPLEEGADKNLSGKVVAPETEAAKFCGYESVMIGDGDGSA